MAVGVRLNCDELLPGGYGTDYSRQVLQRLCEAGLVDFVDLDIALEPQQFSLGMPTVFVEPHVYRPYVEAIRGAAGDVPSSVSSGDSRLWPTGKTPSPPESATWSGPPEP